MHSKLVALAFAAALAAGTAFSAQAASPVNINTADAATIAKSLDGIGISKARAIVAYRKAHGPFKQASDITHVKGVGPATYSHNKDAIRLSGAPAKQTAKH